MATISRPRTDKITTSPELLLRESKAIPSELQSSEKQKLAEATERILQQLTDVELELEPEPLEDLNDYRHVPPKRSFTVLMRCQFKGRGKPRKYPLDDE